MALMETMLDPYLQTPIPTGAQRPPGAAKATRETELSALVVRLQAEIAQHLQEIVALRQQVGYWQAMHRQAMEKIEKHQAENERLRAENRQLKDRLFGSKSEKATSARAGRSFSLAELEATEGAKRRRGQQPGAAGPKRRDYSHLPVVEEPVCQLPAEACVCAACGKPYLPMTETEQSEVLEIEVGAYRRRIRRRRYRATCDCPGRPGTLLAAAPAKLVPKASYGISVWVYLLLEKFAAHRALSNALGQLARYDVSLPLGTVTDGFRRLTPLLEPVYAALLERQGEGSYHQADETGWLVFVPYEGKRGHRWQLWAFASEQTVVFRIAPSRGHEVPEGHYSRDARGYLMVDRYSAYKAMVQVKCGHLLLVFCWAHVRRDFIAVGKGWPELVPWAIGWLRRIREVYRLNRERLKHALGTGEFAEAEGALRAAVAAVEAQAVAEMADEKLPAPCRKVLNSLQNHWTGLRRFVEDRRIPMDNNRMERALRGPALGRKNYYGCGALWSVCLTAAMFSILETLKLWKINARRWLLWYLESCAAAGGKPPADVAPFLPWNLTEQQLATLSETVPATPLATSAARPPPTVHDTS